MGKEQKVTEKSKYVMTAVLLKGFCLFLVFVFYLEQSSTLSYSNSTAKET